MTPPGARRRGRASAARGCHEQATASTAKSLRADVMAAPPIGSGYGGGQGRGRGPGRARRPTRWASTSEASGLVPFAGDRRPGAGGVVEHAGVDGAHRPHQRVVGAGADRAVAVLHRRVGLGPCPGRLAQLERRLVGQADRPARRRGRRTGRGRSRPAAARAEHRGRPPRPPGRRRCRPRRAGARAPWSRTGSGRPTPRRRSRARPRRVARSAHGEPATAVITSAGHAGRRSRPSRRTTSLVVPEREIATSRSYRRPAGSSEAGKASVSPGPAASRAAA